MPKPKQKSIQEQVVQDYQNRIMKAEGNDRIRLMLESIYFDGVTNNMKPYDAVKASVLKYFTPEDEGGMLLGAITRERLKEVTKFMDEEVYLPFQDFRENNPNHSDEWYKEQFTKTKAGMYMDLFEALMSPISFSVSDYKNAFFGKENEDIFGRKRQPGDTVLSTLLAEASKERREQMPAEKVGRLELAEASLRHGTSAMYVKPIKREVITTDLTGDMDGWTDVKLETSEDYRNRQKKLEEAEPKYKQTDQDINELSISRYKNLDFNFIKDDALKKSMQELHQDEKTFAKMNGVISKELYEQNKALFEKLDNFSEKLEKADHLLWINSGAYNDVKKGVQDLRKVLIGGETPENKKAVEDAYKKLSDFCDVYQSKNPGVRKQKTGNQRKEIIADLKQFIEDRTRQPEKKETIQRSGSFSSYSELKKEQDKEQNKPIQRSNSFISKVNTSEKLKNAEGPRLNK